MQWTNYPTERDRKAGTNGERCAGQVWADAPGPGNQWVVPEGITAAVTVTTRASSHGGKPFSIGPHADVKPLADAP
jgi:hypothetical protein